GPWWGGRPGGPQRLLRVPGLCRVGLLRPRQRTTDHGPGTTDTRSAHTTPAPKPPGPLLIRRTRLARFGHAPRAVSGRRPAPPPPRTIDRAPGKISRGATARGSGRGRFPPGPGSPPSVTGPSRTRKLRWVREHHPRPTPRRPKIPGVRWQRPGPNPRWPLTT